MEDFFDIKDGDEIATRFPPEPNGYLHIGHAKSMFINFSLGKKHGTCNLRFDDTNPSNESVEYEDAIRKDVEWLGFKPDNIHYASDYFDKLYEFAKKMIVAGNAYVCELSSEEIKEYMGTTDKPGMPSPYRDTSVDENMSLFEKMKNGEFKDGEATLRAKIDMSSPNVHMRDPIIYRCKKITHHRAGGKWNIYPMYDFAHCLSDAIESITHSICTLEFEAHRPLYYWIINELIEGDNKPRQIEFSRLNLTYTIMSKRKLKELVDNGIVDGWDDPRLPTISGLRRRGYTPNAIKEFCKEIGVTRRESLIDVSLLENKLREDLNKISDRRMVVFDPLKVTITNWDSDRKEEWLPAKINPEDESSSVRNVNFGRTLYIEREDFMEDAPKKFFRLSKGKEVRFKYGYYVTCNDLVKDDNGNIIELLCTYDPNTKGGWSDDGRKVKGTIHWVSEFDNIDIKVNIYDKLFEIEEPTDNFLNEINPNSKMTVTAMMEGAGTSSSNNYYQFERNGYYCLDSDGSWNRTLSLKDSWNKK